MVNPRDTAALAAAMANLLTSPDRRAEFIARGLKQASLFSWDRTARETVAVYRDVRREA
jgi:glycosyltransferase involved in cell wall biosynthesis